MANTPLIICAHTGGDVASPVSLAKKPVKECSTSVAVNIRLRSIKVPANQYCAEAFGKIINPDRNVIKTTITACIAPRRRPIKNK